MSLLHIPSTTEIARVSAQFPNRTPDTLFTYLITPTLLQQWWPQEVENEPRTGGTYHLSWPKMNWHLRGTYTTFQPGQHLAFTWQWDHHPITRTVDILLEPLGSRGTTVTIIHGTYTNSPEDQEERQGHIDGWLHFLSRLQTIAPS